MESSDGFGVKVHGMYAIVQSMKDKLGDEKVENLNKIIKFIDVAFGGTEHDDFKPLAISAPADRAYVSWKCYTGHKHETIVSFDINTLYVSGEFRFQHDAFTFSGRSICDNTCIVELREWVCKARKGWLGYKYAVGTDGFVQLVDTMGTDTDIVQAARISTGSAKKTPEEDAKLIRYLMRHEHTSPFEMVETKWHIRLPIDIMRQLVRHRTASINEYSTRYSPAIDSCAVINPGEWRLQSLTNKQGSQAFDGYYDDALTCIKLTEDQASVQCMCRRSYDRKISLGIAREQARQDLPLSTYTEIYWKINLRNLFHFLKLRLSEEAQKEIREYAQAMLYYAERKFPVATQAFKDYVLNAHSFSAQEVAILQKLIVTVPDERFTEINSAAESTLSQREYHEFLTKLNCYRKGEE